LPSRYAPDLAAIHDAGFGGFARDAAPGLLRRLRRAGIRDGLVVDIGCGSGIWARALTDAGYDVLGVDVSEAMLQIARRRAPAPAARPGVLRGYSALSALSTRSSCWAGLTFRRTSVTRPSSSTTNVVRSLPQYVLPYIDFSTHTP
jgi:SAM-dependent methyltransferase